MGQRKRIVGLFSVALSFVVCCTGCHDTDIRPPPDVVFAVFDPAGQPPRIPLPNDLTMMPAAPSSPAVAQFSAPLNPATITPQSVLVLDVTAMMPIVGAMATFDSANNRLIIMPPGAGWPIGRRVAVALRGGTAGLQGANGQPVVASPAFYFARSQQPISNCTAPAADCRSATPVLEVEQAIALERLRQALGPLVMALGALGVPREELALVWTFTVAGGALPDGGAAADGGM